MSSTSSRPMIASSPGLLKEAITTLHTYLNKAGKERVRYLDALDLLDRTEEELREAEAERKRIEAERRRAEAIRKKHTDLVILTPRSPTGWAATRGPSAWLDGLDRASAARFLPAQGSEAGTNVIPVSQQRPLTVRCNPTASERAGEGTSKTRMVKEYLMKAKQKTMLGVIATVWVTACWGSTTGFAAQLPPEIMVDKYLLQAKMLIEEKDYKGALEAMDRVVVLQKEHDLTLPEEFSFHYAPDRSGRRCSASSD